MAEIIGGFEDVPEHPGFERLVWEEVAATSEVLDRPELDTIDGKLVRMVRGSEVTDYQRCRMRWHLRWNKGYIPNKTDGKLFAGSLFHKFMEVYAATGSAVSAGHAMIQMYNDSPDQSFEASELVGLVSDITDNYCKQWDEKDKGIKVLATEFTFCVPITEDLYYTGTLDQLFEDTEGFMFFKDYKLTNSIEKYQKKSAMDQQISRYWWALEVLANGTGYVQVTKNIYTGLEDAKFAEVKEWLPVAEWQNQKGIHLSSPHGFIYDVVLRDVPTPPKPLKAGGLSIAKDQKTTYDIYLQELKEHGLAGVIDGNLWVEAKYTEIMDHLKVQETDFGNRFFQRFPVTRNLAELQIAIQEFYATASEMWNVEKRAKFHEDFNAVGAEHSPIYRHNTDDCSWDCQFKEYCAATMKGADADWLLSLGYTKEDTKNYANITDFS